MTRRFSCKSSAEDWSDLPQQTSRNLCHFRPLSVMAWDDRGSAAHVRIVRKLQPGEYWLSVRHKDGNATGAYSVGVTTGADDLLQSGA
jgi:hypothetical protein